MNTAVQQTICSAEGAVHPFHVGVSEADITELRRRLSATRWPERKTVTDESQSVTLEMMQGLARNWATDYDWRKIEATPNAVPQGTAEDIFRGGSRGPQIAACIAEHG